MFKTITLRIQEGQREGPVGKGAWIQDWTPKMDPWVPHGRGRELTPTSYPWSTPLCHGTQVPKLTATHTHTATWAYTQRE